MKIIKSLILVSTLTLIVMGVLAVYPALVKAEDNLQTMASGVSTLVATIDQPENGDSFVINQSIDFKGVAIGGVAPYAFVWNFGEGSTRFGQNQSRAYSSTGNKTVTLTVTDSQGRTATASINLEITSGGTNVQPVISNVRATDITQTSVVVLWDTDIPASSRVVYDTVSHSDISGQTAPNFGYAASSDTSDTSPRVTSHSVTISGLNPGTRYFFRVISD